MLVRQAVLLTPPKSSHPYQLLSRQQSAPVNPLAATLMDLPASVANKRLTVWAKPFRCNTYKKQGVPPSSQLSFSIFPFSCSLRLPRPGRGVQPRGTRHSQLVIRHYQLPTGLKFFLFTPLRTLLHQRKT